MTVSRTEALASIERTTPDELAKLQATNGTVSVGFYANV